MRIIRAEHLGMCFGVRDAVALAFKEAAAAPLTILGDLVHNPAVIAELRSRGINVEQSISDVATQRVMITAHGTSNRAREQIKRQGLTMLEATCPLVHVAHQAVVELASAGFHPVIIGKRDHVEVRGLTGDLGAFDVVLNEADVLALTEHARFGVAAQTTQPIEKVQHLVEVLRQCFPRSEVRFADTVCRPTKQRQTAAADLAQQCDAVIVVGGAHSNNTRELAETCRRHCPHVHHVQNVADLRAEWFSGAETVGLTAGTSTPDAVIDEVENALREFSSDSLSPQTKESHELQQMDRAF